MSNKKFKIKKLSFTNINCTKIKTFNNNYNKNNSNIKNKKVIKSLKQKKNLQ